MQLIVAEKPSVARDLARVLGVRPAGQHSFEGERHVITWCVGHLVELDEPATYDPRWKPWRLDTLPMLPVEFRLRPSKHAGAQLRAVTKLMSERRFTSVVNACDAGREGELIFRYVYRFAGGGPPIERLWISSLTDEAIRRGFAALRPGAQFEPLGDAARCRSEADWLVGMNATRAVTLRGRAGGHTALYSIGRVQTPTLAMLVGREQAIRAFVPRDYWEIRGEFRTAAGEKIPAGWRHGNVARLATVELANTITARDRLHGAAVDPLGPRVERIRARTVREPAPLLFDLTSLQRTANRRFGFSAARTVELAQALYERHKILTYPRTDSRHLTTDVVPELPALFTSLTALPDYAAFATELLTHPPRPGRRVVDDAKVHDHHAIIPTGNSVRLEALDRDERRLFDLVVRRFLGVFYPDAEFAITEAWIRVGALAATGTAPRPDETVRTPRVEGEPPVLDSLPPLPDRYLARGRVRLAAGWQAVAGIDGGDERRGSSDREQEAESTAVLPALVEGQALDGAFTALAKQTTPPSRFTEATLLGAMESAGKSIDDETLRLAMKDCGLGTPATRASIIETLLDRDYILRAKQHLVPTPLGIGLIEALPVASLASPELTGTWEARLARVARGEETRATFMTDIAHYVTEMIAVVRGSAPPSPPSGPSGAVAATTTMPGRGVTARAATAIEARAATAMPARGPDAILTLGPDEILARAAIAMPTTAMPTTAMPARGPDTIPARTTTGRAATAMPARAPAARESEASARTPVGPSMPARGTDAMARTTTGRAATAMPARAATAIPARTTTVRAVTPIPDRAPAATEIEPPTRTPVRPAMPAHGPDTMARTTAVRAAKAAPARGPDARPARAATAMRARAPVAAKVERAARPTRAAAVKRKPAATKPHKPAARGAAAGDLSCPRCRRGTLITGARAWGCSRWREGCGFVIWFETAGRRLSAAQLRDLITHGKTKKARFSPHLGNRGTVIEGRLVLDPAAKGGGARFEPA